jgi:hypothetical protein
VDLVLDQVQDQAQGAVVKSGLCGCPYVGGGLEVEGAGQC